MTLDVHQTTYIANRDANGVVSQEKLKDIQDTMGLEAFSVIKAWSNQAARRAKYSQGKPVEADKPKTTITLGGSKGKDHKPDQKAGKPGEGQKVGEGEAAEQNFLTQLTNGPMAQELLGNGLNVEIPTDIIRLPGAPPPPEFGTALASAANVRTANARGDKPKSTTDGDFFKQFNRSKSPSRIG